MNIAIVGSRGVPAGYGGFETFAEEISTRLKASGMEVTVVCQYAAEQPTHYKDVKLLYSKYSKAKQPLRYYFDSIKMVIKTADIILVCGVGGAIFFPLFRRKRTLFLTHVDGREELRGKYSFFKKMFVRSAQLFAAKFSDQLIADSFAVRRHWITKFKLTENKISTIEFGANIKIDQDKSGPLKFNLLPQGYFLVVCRMVPENNPEMILHAFLKSGSDRKLVMVGDAKDAFGISLKRYASEKIIFLDSVYDKSLLFSIRENCFAYIHGHTVGGTNPSLLEAMAAGNICICHDNEFNRETTESKMLYFISEDELKNMIRDTEKFSVQDKNYYVDTARERIRNYYNWERITGEYIKLLHNLSRK